jgi:RimJ/RimL family protein N-acetyltransferase
MEGFRPPVTLTGRWVQLVPLSVDHAHALRLAARDPEVRRFLLHGPGETLEDLRASIDYRLDEQKAGTGLPFTVVLRSGDRPVGMTGFLHIDRTNLSVEVGGTWLDSAVWNTPVNSEAKYLLFQYAFETGKAHRVTLQTDLRNERSQRAIVRVGATREATFRDDKLRPDGSYRTSVYYGILISEWPRVREDLERKLAREWRTPTDPSASGGSGIGPAGES